MSPAAAGAAARPSSGDPRAAAAAKRTRSIEQRDGCGGGGGGPRHVARVVAASTSAGLRGCSAGALALRPLPPRFPVRTSPCCPPFQQVTDVKKPWTLSFSFGRALQVGGRVTVVWLAPRAAAAAASRGPGARREGGTPSGCRIGAQSRGRGAFTSALSALAHHTSTMRRLSLPPPAAGVCAQGVGRQEGELQGGAGRLPGARQGQQ